MGLRQKLNKVARRALDAEPAGTFAISLREGSDILMS